MFLCFPFAKWPVCAPCMSSPILWHSVALYGLRRHNTPMLTLWLMSQWWSAPCDFVILKNTADLATISQTSPSATIADRQLRHTTANYGIGGFDFLLPTLAAELCHLEMRCTCVLESNAATRVTQQASSLPQVLSFRQDHSIDEILRISQ